MAQKWLIINDKISMSRSVEFHSDLVTKPGCEIKGGGLFEIIEKEKKLLFYGLSTDYNIATKDDLYHAYIETTFSSYFDNWDLMFSKSIYLEMAIKDCILIGKIE